MIKGEAASSPPPSQAVPSALLLIHNTEQSIPLFHSDSVFCSLSLSPFVCALKYTFTEGHGERGTTLLKKTKTDSAVKARRC